MAERLGVDRVNPKDQNLWLHLQPEVLVHPAPPLPRSQRRHLPPPPPQPDFASDNFFHAHAVDSHSNILRFQRPSRPSV